MSSFNTISIKGYGIRKERAAGGAINPGHLVKVDAGNTVSVHNVAAGNAAAAFAVENEVFGRGVDVAYASGDNVLYEVYGQGCEVQARLAAGAAAVTRGAFLESAGNGTLRVLAASAATSQAQRASVVAVALESVDNSGGAGEVFIHVEIV